MVLKVKELQSDKCSDINDTFGKKKLHITLGRGRKFSPDFFKIALEDDVKDSPTLKVVDLDKELKIVGTLEGFKSIYK